MRAVPSAWKADAMATRSSPASSSAQRTIFSGPSPSNLAFSSSRMCSAGSVCMETPSNKKAPLRGHRSIPRPLNNESGRFGRGSRSFVGGVGPGRDAMLADSMSAPEPIPPHGGTLVDLVLPGREAERAAEEAQHLPKVTVGKRELSDLEMLAVGALSPLTGFMGEKDYRAVIEDMHLSGA